MSLIHDALKEMDRPQPAAAAPAVRLVRSAEPSATRSALGAFVLVIAVGGLGFWGWQQWRPQAVPQPAAIPAPAVPPAVAVNPVPALPAPAAPVPPAAPADVSAVGTPAQVSAAPAGVVAGPAAPMAAPVSAAPAPADPAAKAASAATPAAHRRPQATAVRPRPAVAARPEVIEEDKPPEQRFALFLQAMKTNDLPAAEAQLKHLREQMSPSSVTLLRAEAWYALDSGDTAGARRQYNAILERLPGDEEASINLASLELADHHVEQARRLLHEALGQNPDSDALKAALARFRDVRN
ncbi:MAG: tetratricopeptide repeat protein [Curvibacter sp.]|nr:tetratricopeptide repeat protein [Curvibacter sp.]